MSKRLLITAVALVQFCVCCLAQVQEKIILLNEGLWQADNGRMTYFEDGAIVSNQWFRDKNGYKLGGEQSGHIIFSDYSTTGDGLITALQVLTAMKKSEKSAHKLNKMMTTFPQVLINVKVQNKEAAQKSEKVLLAIAEGEEELGTSGRILVRASGTEPLIRVMAEGPDKAQLDRICNKIASEIEKIG